MRIFLVVVLICMVLRMPATRALSRPAALVTGSTDGIGVTTAKHFAAKGYDVLIHGRDEARIQRAAQKIHAFAESHSNEEFRLFTLPPADISSLGGCRQLVQDVQQSCKENDLTLSVLMNNAGVFSEELVLTEDGLEQTFAVNVLAPFVITSHLLPILSKQPKSRIVIASSISQCGSIRKWDDLHYSKRPYSAHASYSESKLLDAILTFEMADRLTKAGIGTNDMTCNCLDPGTVNTKMLLAGWGPCGIDVEDALDQTWLCTSKAVENTTGKYFVYKSARRASSSAYDPSERAKLWSLLSELDPEAAAMWNFAWR